MLSHLSNIFTHFICCRQALFFFVSRCYIVFSHDFFQLCDRRHSVCTEAKLLEMVKKDSINGRPCALASRYRAHTLLLPRGLRSTTSPFLPNATYRFIHYKYIVQPTDDGCAMSFRSDESGLVGNTYMHQHLFDTSFHV